MKIKMDLSEDNLTALPTLRVLTWLLKNKAMKAISINVLRDQSFLKYAYNLKL
jgi:hypothetical protein